MSATNLSRARIGVPWRTAAEETAHEVRKVGKYLRAVEQAGGDAVLLSLISGTLSLGKWIQDLDGFVLTGSPSDVDPAHYGAKRHPATENSDSARERTDFALLEHALAKNKPVLAICYGIQSLNVFLGGTLVQDIPTEIGAGILHSPAEEELPDGTEAPDAMHGANLELGRVQNLLGGGRTNVNSWHHQSVREPGRGLRVTARADDSVVEAVEWVADSNWVVGVQWHPERMGGDALSDGLFRSLVLQAERARIAKP